MKQRIFFTAGDSKALMFAERELIRRGLPVADSPSPEVTHLLLDTPCKAADPTICNLLTQLSPDVKIYGGFLDRPVFKDHNCRDLLKDEEYLARNARITAYCAIKEAQERMQVTWEGCPVLILGWGRIGKCLGQLLKALGAEVVVSVRQDAHRAILSALGYEAEITGFPAYVLGRFRVIFNTAPSPLLSAQDLTHCRPGCLKIELSSTSGLECKDVILARGLPGRDAPESSGKLIAQTVLRLDTRKEGKV